MLTLVLGPNGSGKSLYGVHAILKELQFGERQIVTSLALDVGLINEWLHKRQPDNPPDVLRRLLVIGPVEQRTFWRYRGVDSEQTRTVYRDERGLEVAELGVGRYEGVIVPGRRVLGPYGDESWQVRPPNPVLYVLDELQVTFGARQWQATGPEFTPYQSQHRHFGDDVVGICPASALLDKQFRILCGECRVLSNQRKIRKGWFVARPVIKWRSYQNAPPLPGEEPMQTGTIRIDGVADLYDTAGGLGARGEGEADKKQVARGLPIWSLVPALGLAALVLLFIFRAVLHGGAAWGKSKVTISPEAVPQAPARGAQSGPQAAPLPLAGQDIPQRPPPPRWRALALIGGSAHVGYEDGSVMTWPRARVRQVGSALHTPLGVVQQSPPPSNAPAWTPTPTVEPQWAAASPGWPVRLLSFRDGKTGLLIGERLEERIRADEAGPNPPYPPSQAKLAGDGDTTRPGENP